MPDIFKPIKDEIERKHNLYEVGFIKSRQKKEKVFKNFGEASALFKKYKKKYRSAYMKVNEPFRTLALRALNAKNKLLEMIPKRTNFSGESVNLPIKYTGKIPC